MNQNKITLLFPSTGHKRKGLFELLDALTLLPESEFELYVAGNPAKNKTKHNNVRYLGYINNMADLYAAVDFTILPSHYEPFGLVAAESVQCGTPVILSNRVGAKAIITDKEGVIFNGAITAESIAHAIKTAQKKQFQINPHFAQENEITIAEHINKMIALIT